MATFRHQADSPLAGRFGIVLAYAVVHPAGLLVYDTGIGTGDAEPDEVIALACSHLRFDHAGQNAAFPGRPIHVQAAEREAARAADYTVDAWVDFPGARYVEHAGELELLPGVRLIPTPGHTPGHQSLVVETVKGRTMLAGQAVYTGRSGMVRPDPANRARRTPGIRRSIGPR